MARIDPVSYKYWICSQCERGVSLCFYFGALLTVAIQWLPQFLTKNQLDMCGYSFVAVTVLMSVLNLLIRFWRFPVAEELRLGDFFSRAFGTGTSTYATNGYFNDSETLPARKAASQLLEDLFFSKAVSGATLPSAYIKTALWFFIWIVGCISSAVELNLVIFVMQLLFSEEVLVNLARLMWFHHRSDALYNAVYAEVKRNLPEPYFSAFIFEKASIYERIKANTALLLSTSHFNRLNVSLSAQWQTIQRDLGIAQ